MDHAESYTDDRDRGLLEACILSAIHLDRPIWLYVSCAEVFRLGGRPGAILELFTCGGNSATLVSWQ